MGVQRPSLNLGSSLPLFAANGKDLRRGMERADQTTDPLRPGLLSSMGFNNSTISSVLARMTAAGATSEFLFNPMCGRLSDKLGRKTFLVGGLLGSALANFATFLPFLVGQQPVLPLLVFERCLRTDADGQRGLRLFHGTAGRQHR